MEVQRIRKQYRLGALNTLTKQKNVLKPPTVKFRNRLVANPKYFLRVWKFVYKHSEMKNGEE